MRPTRPLLITAVALALVSGCRRPHVSTPPPASAPASVQVADTGPPARLWMKGTANVPVIMYHDVVPKKEVWFDLTVREFEAQMRALAEADATVVPLADVVAHLRDGNPLPPRAIALTFDDGTLGNVEHAFPILQRHGFAATFFVHTDYVGVKTSKDHMTWDQLRELKRSGLIDIQPHTASHPEDLRAMTDEAVREELTKSNAVFEREMGYAPKYLAYPSGHADERVARLVEAAGYEAAFNEERAWAACPADRFHLPRFAPFRLDEVLEEWRRAPADRPSLVMLDASETPVVEPVRVAGVLEGVVGSWGADEVVRGRDTFLGWDGFQPMPDGRQHGSIGRPIVVIADGKVLFAGYQPWMGVERPALDVLLPGATLAVLGQGWLLHEGQVVDTGDRRVQRARILGVTEAGAPFSLRAGDRATAESVSEALIRLGAREAILL